MNPLATAAGVLAAGGPFAFVLAYWVHGPGLFSRLFMAALAGLAALAATLAGLVLARRPRLGRALASVAVGAVLLVTYPAWFTRPLAALPIFTLASVLLAHLWIMPGLSRVAGRQARVAMLRAAPLRRGRASAGAALIAWALYMVGGAAAAPFWPVLLGFAACAWVTLGVLRESGAGARWRYLILAAVFTASAVACVLAFRIGLVALTVSVTIPVAAALLLPLTASAGLGRADWWDPIVEHPARMLVATFLALCLCGSLILALPGASASDRSLGLGDAAFTAVSAVCVTGLTVLDTSADFSFAGQLAILVLIQLGGLGIMTFSTAALRLFGRRLSLRHEAAMAELMSAQDKGRLFASIRLLIVFTLGAELVGGLLLAAQFAAGGDDTAAAIWKGLFTAISAFCNAGFALHANSLVPHQADPLVLYTVGALIVAGGLSPPAVVLLPSVLRGGRTSAQARLVLLTTAILLGVGALFYGAVEWDNSLAGLSFWDKLHNAVFQSITLRTAGFNSVDITGVHPATLSMMMLWMFVGGSPGGTAGGIRTTTVAVLFLAVLATVRGRELVTVFGRHLPHRTVARAAAMAVVAALGVLGGTVLLQLTQGLPTRLLAFEVVSALGTVGLTIGATAELDGIGRAVIMASMFIGRVGTLSLFMMLSSAGPRDPWRLPPEDIELG